MIAELQKDNETLRAGNAKPMLMSESLSDMSAVSDVTVESSVVSKLEWENEILRSENEQLRAELDLRSENDVEVDEVVKIPGFVWNPETNTYDALLEEPVIFFNYVFDFVFFIKTNHEKIC